MARSNLSIVQKAIEIQGYITVIHGQDRRHGKCRSIKENASGEWITDIMTSDLCGFVRVKKTKKDVIERAKQIVAHEAEIRAKRAAEDRLISDRMYHS